MSSLSPSLSAMLSEAIPLIDAIGGSFLNGVVPGVEAVDQKTSSLDFAQLLQGVTKPDSPLSNALVSTPGLLECPAERTSVASDSKKAELKTLGESDWTQTGMSFRSNQSASMVTTSKAETFDSTEALAQRLVEQLAGFRQPTIGGHADAAVPEMPGLKQAAMTLSPEASKDVVTPTVSLPVDGSTSLTRPAGHQPQSVERNNVSNVPVPALPVSDAVIVNSDASATGEENAFATVDELRIPAVKSTTVQPAQIQNTVKQRPSNPIPNETPPADTGLTRNTESPLPLQAVPELSAQNKPDLQEFECDPPVVPEAAEEHNATSAVDSKKKVAASPHSTSNRQLNSSEGNSQSIAHWTLAAGLLVPVRMEPPAIITAPVSVGPRAASGIPVFPLASAVTGKPQLSTQANSIASLLNEMQIASPSVRGHLAVQTQFQSASPVESLSSEVISELGSTQPLPPPAESNLEASQPEQQLPGQSQSDVPQDVPVEASLGQLEYPVHLDRVVNEIAADIQLSNGRSIPTFAKTIALEKTEAIPDLVAAVSTSVEFTESKVFPLSRPAQLNVPTPASLVIPHRQPAAELKNPEHSRGAVLTAIRPSPSEFTSVQLETPVPAQQLFVPQQPGQLASTSVMEAIAPDLIATAAQHDLADGEMEAAVAANLGAGIREEASASSESPVAKIEPKTVHQLVSAAVSEAVRLPGGSHHRFRMRLDPPELGGITIEISRNHSGETSIQITADSPDTQSLLERGANEISQSLNDQGLSLSHFDLSQNQQHTDAEQVQQTWTDMENARLIREARKNFESDLLASNVSIRSDQLNFRA